MSGVHPGHVPNLGITPAITMSAAYYTYMQLSVTPQIGVVNPIYASESLSVTPAITMTAQQFSGVFSLGFTPALGVHGPSAGAALGIGVTPSFGFVPGSRFPGTFPIHFSAF